ncbi:AKR_HP2_G0020970.mRNA.1.CDS.1 [Saccharomyces cerevisiae]|nr:AKR_HP2_G0020970.mRNA.1.CDS.1 [Saccharomyces cerevisiae]CAI6515246.1 AKR_HP2_G0020970.mRNA.1.CDS.1 [Saccharomyces cerevisiae]
MSNSNLFQASATVKILFHWDSETRSRSMPEEEEIGIMAEARAQGYIVLSIIVSATSPFQWADRLRIT